MTFHCPDRSEADQACNATEREQPQPKQARLCVPHLKRRLFEYYSESDDERFNVLTPPDAAGFSLLISGVE
ncbi:hypothetical protein T4E_6793 [Trichinella pseudospiralis]|uniref:Uncharacterized protein n=1 Tax=Trichinella pseudospiralis TaxID=6337 RepID=A0A0V0XEA6_TRIPS|nr:hypothetical protein T4E_6793 [Trichinella pseudospiralis]